MPKVSSGILLYKKDPEELSVLLCHMGGPFWAKKDNGSWSIPKGEVVENEDVLTAAKCELAEELGGAAPEGDYVDLGEVKLASGKVVRAFAVEGDFTGPLKSNTFTMEWPPRSGRQQEFPEVDRAEWYGVEEARLKILPAQEVFLDTLREKIL